MLRSESDPCTDQWEPAQYNPNERRRPNTGLEKCPEIDRERERIDIMKALYFVEVLIYFWVHKLQKWSRLWGHKLPKRPKESLWSGQVSVFIWIGPLSFSLKYEYQRTSGF